ncbi:MAG: hypothetical protein AAGG44_19515, partial [Planctomycetota bacterium]
MPGSFRQHGLPKNVLPHLVIRAVQRYADTDEVISLVRDVIERDVANAILLGNEAITQEITKAAAWTQIGESLAALPMQPDLTAENMIQPMISGLLAEGQHRLARNLVRAQAKERGAATLTYLNYESIYRDAESHSETNALFPTADPQLGSICLELVQERMDSDRLLPSSSSNSVSLQTPRFLRRLMQVLPAAGPTWSQFRSQLVEKPESDLSAAEATLLCAIYCSEQKPQEALPILDRVCRNSDAVTNMGLEQAWELYAWLVNDFNIGYQRVDRVLGSTVNMNDAHGIDGLKTSLLGFIVRCSCRDERPDDAFQLLTHWTRSQQSPQATRAGLVPRTARYEQASRLMAELEQPEYALQFFANSLAGIRTRSDAKSVSIVKMKNILELESVQAYLPTAASLESPSLAIRQLSDVAISPASNRGANGLNVKPRRTLFLSANQLRQFTEALKPLDPEEASLSGLLMIGILAKQMNDTSRLEAVSRTFAARAREHTNAQGEASLSDVNWITLQKGLCFFLDIYRQPNQSSEDLLTALDVLAVTSRRSALSPVQRQQALVHSLQYLNQGDSASTIAPILRNTLKRMEPDSEQSVCSALEIASEAARYGEEQLSLAAAAKALRYGPHGTQLDANVAEAFPSQGPAVLPQLQSTGAYYNRPRAANAGITQRFR